MGGCGGVASCQDQGRDFERATWFLLRASRLGRTITATRCPLRILERTFRGPVAPAGVRIPHGPRAGNALPVVGYGKGLLSGPLALLLYGFRLSHEIMARSAR